MELSHVDILFQIMAFLFAICVHESAHAWTASLCGDPTARMLGRVTLNPVRHIDPVGTVLLPLIAAFTHFPMIGWAKPTPVDPRNFRNPVRDDILVSVAGPASNMVVALFAVMVLTVIRFASGVSIPELVLGAGASFWQPLVLMFYELMYINILLAIFNLIPVPPLDGSHVVRHMLPDGARQVYDRVGMFGLIALLLFGGGLLRTLISPVVNFLNGVLERI